MVNDRSLVSEPEECGSSGSFGFWNPMETDPTKCGLTGNYHPPNPCPLSLSLSFSFSNLSRTSKISLRFGLVPSRFRNKPTVVVSWFRLKPNFFHSSWNQLNPCICWEVQELWWFFWVWYDGLDGVQICCVLLRKISLWIIRILCVWFFCVWPSLKSLIQQQKNFYLLSYQQKNILYHIRLKKERKKYPFNIRYKQMIPYERIKKKKNPNNFVVYIAHYSLDHNNFKQWKKCSRTFGSSSLGLPVIVARAEFLVPISSWRNT